MSKFVQVQFSDATDISTLVVDSVVAVGTVSGGVIISVGTMQNMPAPALPAHTHSLDAPGANTGPAVSTP